MDIQIKFEGVDNWNRPVFKDLNSSARFGSVDKLFSYDSTSEQATDYFKNNMGEIEYFGQHFGCEPG